ncbi:hypothetical protein A4G18_00450 [Pasteurellaceae bacterium Pebbles2]|nr:hypothetical protein [Pasteurellaceae bacterium Pebbles2]
MGLAAFNRMRRLRAEQSSPLPTIEELKDYSKAKVDEIKAKLTTLNISFEATAKKEQLLEVLKQALKRGQEGENDQSEHS